MWFLASAYGQYVAGYLGAGMVSPNENATIAQQMTAYTNGYYQLAIYAFVTGGVIMALSYWMNKLMKDRT